MISNNKFTYWEGRDICEKIVNLENEEDPDSTFLHEVLTGRIERDLPTVISAAPASVNTLDEYGFAPIHWAVLNTSLDNRLASISLLLENGADVNLQTKVGETALYLAVRIDLQEVVQLLLDAGAEVNTCTSYGHSPLMRASRRLELHLVELLLKAGADPQQMDMNGETALHEFARSDFFDTKDTEDIATLAHKLIKAGGQLEQRNYDGDTPLLCAVWNDNAESFRVLYHLGARLNSLDNDDRTVLHAAALSRTWGLFTALREAVPNLCVDPDLEDRWGDTGIDEFEWRIRLMELSEQDRAVETLYRKDVPLLSEEEINCFRELIHEIRVVHNFPKGRPRCRQGAVEVPMPGAWPSKVEEMEEESDDGEVEANIGINDGGGDGDESWETASESA